jgi:CheY-like chemotaxis protein
LNILILEDDKRRVTLFKQYLIGSSITITEHTDDCIKYLEENTWDILFLDHDLDQKVYVPSGPGTGYEVAMWLKNNPERVPKHVILHTCNEKAAPLMLEALPNARWIPAVSLLYGQDIKTLLGAL